MSLFEILQFEERLDQFFKTFDLSLTESALNQ